MKNKTIYLPNISIYLVKKESNKLTYNISKDINKVELKGLLESLYNFKVKKVNILNKMGKFKRNSFGLFKKKNFKKAIVTI